MSFDNVYEDPRRAQAYAKLEFPGTYYLAYRDLPEIISKHFTSGKRALDFGCGTGRSTRFLKNLGFDAIGVDISPDMVKLALAADPQGQYRVIPDDGLISVAGETFDLALAVFTFDNIPTLEKKVSLFQGMGKLLNKNGRIVSLVSSPEIYTHEWASFTTRDFPENRTARSGHKVKIVMTDVEDQRPVEDIIWFDEAYCDVYRRAGLELLETYRPLANESEPYQWVSETTVPPWVIYVLQRS
jgi:SAM-dependent methyltransferase